MKIFIAVVTLVVALCCGCTTNNRLSGKSTIVGDIAAHDSRPGVQSQYPGEFMYVSSSGTKAAFSAREIEGIAKNYIQAQKVPYDISGSAMTIWIDTSGGEILATVDFGKGVGKQGLVITIDKNGRVMKHEILLAVD